MKKRLPIWATGLLCCACMVLAVVLTLQFCYRFMFLDTKNEYERQLSALTDKLAPPEDKTAFADLPDKFEKIYNELLDDSIDKPDEKALESDVLHGLLTQTGDEYARYLTKSEYRDYYYSTHGTTVGIGVMISKSEDGRAILTHVEKNAPAGKAGLTRGDEILAVDGVSLAENGYDKTINLIAGEEKTNVTLTVRRKSGVENNVVLTRETVKFAGVRYTVEDGIGYLRLLSLGSDTVDEYKEAVDALVKAGVSALVIDVRGVSGGTLKAASQCVDYLLSDKTADGKEIVAFKTLDAHENVTQYILSDGHGVDLPVAVLVNASVEKVGEIFAGALRRIASAKVYGEKTAGNGTVQSLLVLKDGSAIIYTSGKILFGDDSDLTGGVEPDKSVSSEGVNIYLVELSEDPVFTAAAEELKTNKTI